MIALVVDDEQKARNLLKIILEESCPDVIDIYEAEDLPSAVMLINKTKPDVVFLDIEMPGYRGTQILEFFPDGNIDFEIVFTTAYNDFALKAFDLNALSYLLKPIRPRQVKEVIEKTKKNIVNKNIVNQLKELENNFKSNTVQKIGLPISDGLLFVKLEDIVFLKADSMYTEVHCKNEKHIISKPLKFFVSKLEDNSMFFRSHRSYMLNVNYVKQLVKADGGYVLMDNDEIVSATKERLDDLALLI